MTLDFQLFLHLLEVAGLSEESKEVKYWDSRGWFSSGFLINLILLIFFVRKNYHALCRSEREWKFIKLSYLTQWQEKKIFREHIQVEISGEKKTISV